MERLILITLSVYCISLSIEAPIRYFLQMIGLPYLIYIRDILMIIAVSWYVVKKASYKLLVIIGIIILYSLISLYYTANIVEVAWGIKTIFPFVFGICCCKICFKNREYITKIFMIIFIMSCLGMMLNYFIEEPFWQDINGAEVMGVTTEGVRNWDIYVDGEKVSRLSGFTKLAGTTALIIIYSLVWLLNFYKYKILLLAVSFPMVLLTTSKVNIGMFLYIIVIMIMRYFANENKYIFSLKISIIMFAFIGIVLPIVSIIMKNYVSVLDSDMLLLIFASTEDRMLNSWPGTLNLVWDYGNVFLGRGIGGVGYGVSLFDVIVTNLTPIDNFYVFIYGNMGLLGIAFVLLLILSAIKLNKTLINEFLLLMLMLFAGESIMSDMADQFSMIIIGIITGRLLLYELYDDIEV